MEKRSLTRLALAGIVAGGFALSACDHNTSTKTESTGITGAKTLAEFQEKCTELKGTYSTHECEGLNTCKGQSFQAGKGVVSHECKGKSACAGGSCKT